MDWNGAIAYFKYADAIIEVLTDPGKPGLAWVCDFMMPRIISLGLKSGYYKRSKGQLTEMSTFGTQLEQIKVLNKSLE